MILQMSWNRVWRIGPGRVRRMWMILMGRHGVRSRILGMCREVAARLVCRVGLRGHGGGRRRRRVVAVMMMRIRGTGTEATGGLRGERGLEEGGRRMGYIALVTRSIIGSIWGVIYDFIFGSWRSVFCVEGDPRDYPALPSIDSLILASSRSATAVARQPPSCPPTSPTQDNPRSSPNPPSRNYYGPPGPVKPLTLSSASSKRSPSSRNSTSPRI